VLVRSCDTSQVHEAFFWAIFFAPTGHRLNVFLRHCIYCIAITQIVVNAVFENVVKVFWI